MPTTEESSEGQPSGSREDRLTQLKQPAPLDFEEINLAYSLRDGGKRKSCTLGFSNVWKRGVSESEAVFFFVFN